jgi:hypothetical protein
MGAAEEAVTRNGNNAPDNTPEGLRALLRANERCRTKPWPRPFNRTVHRLHTGDARDLSWIADESAHLIVTSPPYWTLKEYRRTPNQMGFIEDYDHFLDELDKSWRECARILVPRWPHLLRCRRRVHFTEKGWSPLRDAAALRHSSADALHRP